MTLQDKNAPMVMLDVDENSPPPPVIFGQDERGLIYKIGSLVYRTTNTYSHRTGMTRYDVAKTAATTNELGLDPRTAAYWEAWLSIHYGRAVDLRVVFQVSNRPGLLGLEFGFLWRDEQ